MRYHLLLLLAFAVCGHVALAQNDSLQQLSLAPLSSKAVTVDLNNPDEVDLMLKKIHTYKYIETLELEGETDEATLKKIFYRLSTLKNLTTLELKDNELKTLPDNISNVNTLRTISIEGNSEMDYDDLCTKLSKMPIAELDLTDNDLQKVPASLSLMASLRTVKVSENHKIKYAELIDKLRDLPNLRELAIPVNSIGDLPENITELRSLQVLDVSENVLTELPDGVAALKNLNNLSIQGNLFLNPIKELEKLKGADIRYLSVDKEISGEDLEKIKKIFPNAEISFPIDKQNELAAPPKDTVPDLQAALPKKPVKNTGDLTIKKDFRILSDAYLSFPSLFRNVRYNFDTLTFAERYSNTNYSNVYQRLPNRGVIGGLKLRNKLYNKGHLSEIWFQMPPNKSRTVRFLSINLWTRTFDNSGAYMNYPELTAFTGMYWVYQGDMSRRKFRKKILRKTHSDIRILFDKNNSTFNIEFKTDTTFTTISAYPLQVKDHKQPIEKSQESYLRRYQNYQRTLARRTSQFDRTRIRAKRRYNADFKKLQDYAWKELQLRMSDDEKIMSREEWQAYYDEVIENEISSIDNAPLALNYLERGLVLKKVNMVPNTGSGFLKPVLVDFVNAKDGSKLAVNTVIVVDQKNKTYIKMPGTLGLATMALNIKQYAGYCIFVELRSGNIGVVNAAEIDKQQLVPNQQYSIKCRIFDKNLNSIGDCLKESGIN